MEMYVVVKTCAGVGCCPELVAASMSEADMELRAHKLNSVEKGEFYVQSVTLEA